MQSLGLKYGFVSTCNETVLLKIENHDDGTFELFYSPRIYHTDAVVVGQDQKLSKLSTRLCMMFILHLASSPERSDWKFDGNEIAGEWTNQKPDNNLGQLGGVNKPKNLLTAISTGQPVMPSRALTNGVVYRTHGLDRAFGSLTLDDDDDEDDDEDNSKDYKESREGQESKEAKEAESCSFSAKTLSRVNYNNFLALCLLSCCRYCK